MLEIVIIAVGVIFIALSLWLAYRQEKLIGNELRKREVRLNRLLDKLNGALAGLEEGEELITQQQSKSTLQQRSEQQLVQQQRTEQSNDFSNTLEAKLAKKLENYSSADAKELTQDPSLQQVEDRKDQQSATKDKINEAVDKHQQVNKLLNSGLNYDQIAQRLNLGQREVELICKLTNRGEG
ncbi:MAG: hypothetical protein ACQEQI_00220 [Bacillota bacterium]